MKKILNSAIIGILIISGFGAVVAGLDSDFYQEIDNLLALNIEFSDIKISEYSQEYLEFSPANEGSFYMNPGKPMIPEFIKLVELPFGAKNIDVKMNIENINTQEISKQIRPSPRPLPLNYQNTIGLNYYKDKEIYESESLYPSNWFEFSTGCGINENLNHSNYCPTCS